MNKNIEVVDEAGNVYEPTWPKRAKGLVKHGRARFVDENKICLTCPPDMKTEETHMNSNIFGDMTVADILDRINNIINQTSYIGEACEALASMDDSNDSMEAKAEAIATVVRSRETTNQHILRLYEKIYDDLLRLNSLAAQSEESWALE